MLENKGLSCGRWCFLKKKLVFNKDCNSANQMFISHLIFERIWDYAI